jgi:hypothetical protein
VVFEAIGSAARAFASGGYFVVLDSLIRPRYVDILLDNIKSNEIELHLVVLRPGLCETQSRSRQRDEADRHSDEILEELHGAFRELGGLESHVIDNTTLDENQTVEAIRLRMELGELRI